MGRRANSEERICQALMNGCTTLLVQQGNAEQILAAMTTDPFGFARQLLAGCVSKFPLPLILSACANVPRVGFICVCVNQ